MPLPSTKAARLTGYLLVLGILGVMVGFMAFVVVELQSKPPLVRVGFPGISTLNTGDPVVENGVEVGRVHDITLVNGVAVTTLRLYRHRILPEDTRFFNLSHSLMGARKVWMIPGDSPQALDPARLQPGFYVPGLPETLHKATELTAIVTRLRAVAESLLYTPPEGTHRQSSVAALHHLDKAGTVLADLSASLAEAEVALRAGLKGLESATTLGDTVASGVRQAGPLADSAVMRATFLLAAFGNVEGPLESALATAERLAEMAADSVGPGRFLNSEGDYRNLVKTVEALDSIASALRKGGLGDDVKIKPRLRNPAK